MNDWLLMRLLLRGLFAEIDRIRVLKPRIIDSFALVAEKRYNRARSDAQAHITLAFIDVLIAA